MTFQNSKRVLPVWSQPPAVLASLLGGSSGCNRRRTERGIPGRTGWAGRDASLQAVGLDVWRTARSFVIYKHMDEVWQYDLLLTSRPHWSSSPPQKATGARARRVCARGRGRCGSASEERNLTNLKKQQHKMPLLYSTLHHTNPFLKTNFEWHNRSEPDMNNSSELEDN